MEQPSHHGMADALRSVGLEASFPELHHFSQPQFLSEKPSLKKFCRYCDRTNDFQDVSENAQTIRRVNAFIAYARKNVSHDQSLAKVWEEFPLVTR